MIYECHLLWGDILSYAWGPTDKRIEIPIKNQKQRQTYYGALDYQTKEFIVKEFKSGNIEIPIKNQKQRQTYYGALDYQTKEFIVKECKSGNTENTIEFIKYLQQQRPGKRLAIFWDGATPA